MIDPPSAQKGSFMVEKDYPKVLRKLHKLLAHDAEILACVNAPWLDYAWLRTALQRICLALSALHGYPARQDSTKPKSRH